MKASESSKQKLSALFSDSELKRAFYIFSVIYFPVGVLFLDNGKVSEAILLVYSLALSFAAARLIWIFMLLLGRMLDKKDFSIQKLLRLCILNAIIPLLVLKVITYAVFRMLAHKSTDEFWCSLKQYLWDLYSIFNPQQSINYTIFFVVLSTILVIAYKLLVLKKF